MSLFQEVSIIHKCNVFSSFKKYSILAFNPILESTKNNASYSLESTRVTWEESKGASIKSINYQEANIGLHSPTYIAYISCPGRNLNGFLIL